MKRALYNQPDATPCGSTDNRKRNKTANLLHPFKNGAGKLLLTLFLMLASMGAWAQTNVANCYVFNNGTYGYLYNNNGTLASNGTFRASSVWIASGTLGTTNRTLQSYTNKAQYMRGSAGNGDAVSIGNSASVWQMRDNYLATRGTAYTYYLQTANGTTFTTRRNSINERFAPTAITVTEYPAINNTTGGFSSVGLSAANITYGGTAVTATLTSPALNKDQRVAYTDFLVSGNHYYWWDNADKNAAPTRNQGAVALTLYEWSLSGAGASYLSLANATTTGLTNTITYTTPNPNADAAATVTVKAVYADGTEITKAATITAKRYTADPTAINASDMELVVGATQSVNPTLTCSIPDYSNIYTSFSYASNNTAVASVNATTGVVTANAKGTATITITARLQGGGSITKDITVTVAERAAAPTITFNNTTGELTMSSTTPRAEIHYTLTGSDPSSGSATYNDASKPVLTQGATVKAITVADGYLNSNVTTLVVEQVATPTVTVSGTTVTLACATAGVTYYYTTDGSDPTLSSTSTTSTTLTTIPSGSTIKVMAVKNGMVSSEVASKYVEFSLATPTITISSGTVTMTSPDGATIHYTTDGSEPTASSPTYSAPLTATNGMTYKAIAVKAGYANSDVAEEKYMIASGVSNGVVTLNDYEDHTWTYYAGVPEEVDGGNYNTKYLGKLYSPNPRNVKITYNGVNGIENSNITVKVSTRTGEGQTSFVYYKTLEEGATAGQYPYQVISNPFSVRPSTGTGNGKVYYGFNGWKIVSGGEYINGYNNGQTLPLDAEITFVNLPYPNVNCTSAEIVFETTWTQANVQRGGGNVSNAAFNGGNYEKNFCIINANYTTALAPAYPVTITSVEPDGSQTYNVTFSNLVTPVAGAANTTKLEYITWNPSGNIDARGRNFTIGRGVTTSTSRELYGTNQTAGATNIIDQVLKVESGTYSYFRHFTSSGTNRIRKQIVVFGCDYDRAKADNDKIKITGRMIGAEGSGAGDANGNHDANLFMSKTYMKSGTFMSNVALAGAGYQNSYYLGINAASNATGKRLFEMEGGDLQNSIAGGMDVDKTGTKDDEDYINVYIRIRGGHVKGCIYGAARYALSQGSRQIVITGGEVNSWIAGGANGDEETQGATSGASYIYVGGNAIVGSKDGINSANSNTSIGSSIGGCVYGAGCGYGPNSTSGNMVLGTNVVVADEAYIERGVYGGGAFGYCATDKTANIYITGGHVEGKSGNYKDRAGTTTNGIIGGVFGGARMRYGGSANIYMTGGWVETGVFGGSNYTGTMEGNVKMVITGGKVGTDATHTGNVHGGGYGQPTRVSGNVDISIGTRNTETGALYGNAVIYGDVYGGSALGYVNGTTATNTLHTNVTLNAGTINGSLYGGGLGDAGNAANVYGPVQVKVYGGSVKKTDANGANGSGAVYGANNINGAPQRSVTVDIYGTDPAPAQGDYALFSVYGGGNAANYTYGNGYPKVTVHNCENSIEYVYGGGNAAAVAQTDVTIWGGNKIGNVFGGGNGQVRAANVTGGTSVKIYGGTIGDVYGGSNTNGTIGGTISVNVNAQAEGGSAACPVNIDNVYGGGNKAASAAGNITIGCIGENGIIGAVYGGANQANITGNINLNITGGRIRSVFGGNNNGGTITGSITVNVDWGSSCSWNYLENVYGGGNKAAYSAPNSDGKNWPKVNIRNAVIEESVFGGGLGESALVTGNPQVTVSTQCPTQGHTNDHMVHIKGSLYGGGSAAPVTGNPVVNTRGLAGDAKKVQIDNYVFGGGFGQTAVVTGNTDVNIKGNTVVNKNVYGGGNGGLVTGNTNIVIGD